MATVAAPSPPRKVRALRRKRRAFWARALRKHGLCPKCCDRLAR